MNPFIMKISVIIFVDLSRHLLLKGVGAQATVDFYLFTRASRSNQTLTLRHLLGEGERVGKFNQTLLFTLLMYTNTESSRDTTRWALKSCESSTPTLLSNGEANWRNCDAIADFAVGFVSVARAIFRFSRLDRRRVFPRKTLRFSRQFITRWFRWCDTNSAVACETFVGDIKTPRSII